MYDCRYKNSDHSGRHGGRQAGEGAPVRARGRRGDAGPAVGADWAGAAALTTTGLSQVNYF